MTCAASPRMANDWITPDWPAPTNVRTVSTTRAGGVSAGVYTSFNLGQHVGDDPRAVAENRRHLRTVLGLRREPRWLKQIHGNRIALLTGSHVAEESDSAVTQYVHEACVVMTADCLPVLFCDRAGKIVAAAHAGWRGLAASVLEATISAMHTPPEEILAWLGPAIGPDAYEVGEEVRAALVNAHPQADEAFEPVRAGKLLCDLYLLASQRLRQAGVRHIYGGGFCTYSERERFFSYRRDGECGRMASLIWLDN